MGSSENLSAPPNGGTSHRSQAIGAELRELAELRDSGQITQIEYDTLRARLIGAPPKRRSASLVAAIAVAVVLVAVVATGMLLARSGDDEASPNDTPTSTRAPTTTAEAAVTTTTAEPATTTSTTVEPTTTIDRAQRTQDALREINLAAASAQAKIFAQAIEREQGALWAPNGLSTASVLDCFAQRIQTFTRNGQDELQSNEPVYIFTLTCAGYSDQEALDTIARWYGDDWRDVING